MEPLSKEVWPSPLDWSLLPYHLCLVGYKQNPVFLATLETRFLCTSPCHSFLRLFQQLPTLLEEGLLCPKNTVRSNWNTHCLDRLHENCEKERIHRYLKNRLIMYWLENCLMITTAWWCMILLWCSYNNQQERHSPNLLADSTASQLKFDFDRCWQ